MDSEPFTYDALRNLERQENTSPRLMRLEPRFWERLGEHLASLRQAFQDQQEDDPTARRTVVLADELRNTQRLAESIWALREKKVVHVALAAARRREGTKAVPENATPEERDLFIANLEVLNRARDEAAITDPFARRRRERLVKEQEQHAVTAAAEEEGGAQREPPQASERGIVAAVHAATAGGAGSGTAGLQTTQTGEEARALEGRGGMGADSEPEVELRVVEALKAVPRFAGPDLVTYALEEGEVGSLPRKAAEILAGRGLVRILPL